MPYLSDQELASLTRSERAELDRPTGDAHVGAPMLSLVPALGGMGAAGIVGFLRSKMGDPNTGAWKLPGTNWDAEGVLVAALASVAFFGKHVGIDPEWRGWATIGAFGIGSHYLGELGRQFGRTGQMSWNVGAGVPPWDPTSFDPSQLGDPYADPQAQGLSSSGV